jgi:hypothetical protein
MATQNSIFRAIVIIFNNCQCHCQRISIIKWYYPAKEGRSGRTAAVRVHNACTLAATACNILILIGYHQHLATFFESIVT